MRREPSGGDRDGHEGWEECLVRCGVRLVGVYLVFRVRGCMLLLSNLPAAVVKLGLFDS